MVLEMYLLVLAPILVTFILFLVYMALRCNGLIEEDRIGEPKLVSPAFKLVKNVITKSFTSVEILLILISIYVLSFNVATVSSFAYTSHPLEIEPQYSALLIKRDIVIPQYVSNISESYVILNQVFNGVEIGNDTFYFILAKCDLDDVYRRNELAGILQEYCDYLDKGYILVDESSNISRKAIVEMLDADVGLRRVRLSAILDLELAPGIYVIHSIGVVGGLSIRIEKVDKIVFAPLTWRIIDRVCNVECDAQSIVICFDDVEKYSEKIDELLNKFDYIILGDDGGALAVSRSLVPSPETIFGMVLSFVMSMIIMYSVGGGYIEKITSIGENLFILGFTRELYISTVILGTAITLAISSIPMVAATAIGLVSYVAMLNYIASALGFIIITSRKLHSSIGKPMCIEVLNNYSYVVDTYVSPSVLTECLKDVLKEDDFFYISEIESIKENLWVIRIELIYKKALSTLASVEIYIDKVDHGVEYTIAVDVWSMEDLPREIINSIQRLALAKIVGGVEECLEG